MRTTAIIPRVCRKQSPRESLFSCHHLLDRVIFCTVVATVPELHSPVVAPLAQTNWTFTNSATVLGLSTLSCNIVLGVRISRDPLEQMFGIQAELIEGPNLYRYGLNNPVNKSDKFGLICTVWDLMNMWKYYAKDRPFNAPFEDAYSRGYRMEREVMGNNSDYDGGFRHCLMSCEMKRATGTMVSGVVHTALNFKEDLDGHHKDDASDKKANCKGRKAADKEGSCAEECLKSYPKIP